MNQNSEINIRVIPGFFEVDNKMENSLFKVVNIFEINIW